MSDAPAGGAKRPRGEDDAGREMLRHTLATLAYRGAKAVSGAPPEFAGFQVHEGSRTPVQILAHVGDLMEWALSMARGKATWHDSAPLGWDAEVARFFAEMEKLDAFLASDAPLEAQVDGLFQGPIADALTHVGQIAMLRRVAGAPIRGENYYMAEIVPGRVGPEQAPPRREFD